MFSDLAWYDWLWLTPVLAFGAFLLLGLAVFAATVVGAILSIPLSALYHLFRQHSN